MSGSGELGDSFDGRPSTPAAVRRRLDVSGSLTPDSSRGRVGRSFVTEYRLTTLDSPIRLARHVLFFGQTQHPTPTPPKTLLERGPTLKGAREPEPTLARPLSLGHGVFWGVTEPRVRQLRTTLGPRGCLRRRPRESESFRSARTGSPSAAAGARCLQGDLARSRERSPDRQNR